MQARPAPRAEGAQDREKLAVESPVTSCVRVPRTRAPAVSCGSLAGGGIMRAVLTMIYRRHFDDLRRPRSRPPASSPCTPLIYAAPAVRRPPGGATELHTRGRGIADDQSAVLATWATPRAWGQEAMAITTVSDRELIVLGGPIGSNGPLITEVERTWTDRPGAGSGGHERAGRASPAAWPPRSCSPACAGQPVAAVRPRRRAEPEPRVSEG